MPSITIWLVTDSGFELIIWTTTGIEIIPVIGETDVILSLSVLLTFAGLPLLVLADCMDELYKRICAFSFSSFALKTGFFLKI